MKVNEMIVSLIDQHSSEDIFSFSDQSQIAEVFSNKFEVDTVVTIDEELYAINEVTVSIEFSEDSSTVNVKLFTEKLGSVDDFD